VLISGKRGKLLRTKAKKAEFLDNSFGQFLGRKEKFTEVFQNFGIGDTKRGFSHGGTPGFHQKSLGFGKQLGV